MHEMTPRATRDDRLRALGRAARAEVEAGLDTDTALEALRARAATFAPEPPTALRLHPARRNQALVVLGTAATAVLVVGGAIWIGSTDDTITTTAATTLPRSLPATTDPVPTVTAPSTTPPTDPPSTTTTAPAVLPAEPVIPPGSIDLGPADLIARAADGDVWWYPGALAADPDDRILLIDRPDPREQPDEGEGPNFIDHVAGTFNGSLVYSDCCEPVSGNLFAIAEPGAEADLSGSPDSVSRTARLWGVGYSPRFEPGGSRIVAMNWDYLGITDLATGANESIMTFDAGSYGGYEAAWAGGSIAALVRPDEGGLLLSVRDPDDLATELHLIEIVPPSDDFPAAGIVGGTPNAVTIYVRDDAGPMQFVTVEAGAWTIVDEPLGFDVPADASEMHLSADGNLMTWVVDGVGWAQRRSAAAVRIDDGLAEIWVPEVRGEPVPSSEPPASTIPVTTIPVAQPAEVSIVDWRDLTYETSGITNSCVRLSLHCTRVIHDMDGTPISYDPNTRVLTRHGVPVVTATLPESYGLWPWLYHAGPDHVVYLQVEPATPAELAADLVAVSLSADDAGREIARWDGVVSTNGDNELAAAPEGLVNVNCCGPDPVRPAPFGQVLAPWVDRSGLEVVSTGPSIRATVYPGLTIARSEAVPAGGREWSVRTTTGWLNRGMPQATPTFDGGFLAALQTGAGSTIVRGWPDGDVEQIELRDVLEVSLDRNGRVLIGDGDRIWRVDVFADRTTQPTDAASIDVEAGTVSIPDSGGITATWTMDPVAFADAVRGPLAVNEQRTVAAEQRSATEWLVTVTTSNFFDDSVFADRWELTLERADDGRFSFVSGRWSNVCQPNRGHQDFQPALCV